MTTSQQPAVSAGLASRLREGTWPLHREVERSTFMRAMLQGQLDAASYCLLLRNLHAVYAELEAALADHASHPALSAIDLPAVRRADAIAEDLGHLHGPDWPTALELLPAASDYHERLAVLRRHQPALLVAHAYVRYLGDLSGGQQLKRIVARSLHLPDSVGTAFYEFGNPAQCKSLATAMRTGLDAIQADAEQIALTVAEACEAFRRHGALFDQLAGAAGMRHHEETLTAP